METNWIKNDIKEWPLIPANTLLKKNATGNLETVTVAAGDIITLNGSGILTTIAVAAGELVGLNASGVLESLGSDAITALLATASATTNGGCSLIAYAAEADITTDASVDILVNVPAGSAIVGTQLINSAALATGDDYDAAYATGATAAIGTNVAIAVDTETTTFFDANAATNIASDVTIVQLTLNGGGSFSTAQGTVKAITYAWTLSAW